MKKFKFRLERILKLREHIEKDEKNRFQGVLKQYNAIESNINDMTQRRKSLLTESQDYVQDIDITSILLRDKAREGLKNKITISKKLLREKKVELERAREKYLKRKREKKAIEILKNKQWVKYLEEYRRDEQNVLDEQGSYVVSYRENPLVNKELIKNG